MGIFLTVRTLLLQALVRGEGYGLELAARVEEMAHHRIGPGRLYPELRSMETDGLVTSWEGAPTKDRGGRPRVYYRLTAAGKRAAAQERRTSSSVFSLVPEGVR